MRWIKRTTAIRRSPARCRRTNYIVTNPDRRNKEAIKIDNNMDLSVAQFQVLQEAKGEINQVSNVFNAQKGEGKSGQSGYALNTLVEQGTTTLAEIGDNYRFSRTRVHELVLEHIKRDSTHPHEVTTGEGQQRKTIFLNQPVPEDSGPMVNDVQMSTARVILQEVPSTPGYRQQQFMMLAEMTKGLPPQIQQFIIPFVIEASDQQDRKKIATTLRRALNIPEDGAEGQQPQIPPEVAQMIEQGKALVQQQQMTIQDLTEKLQKAMNTLNTQGAKHEYTMQELDKQKELATIKHATTRTQLAGPAGAQVDAIKPLLDTFEGDVNAKIDNLTALVQQMAAMIQQPMQQQPQQPGAM